MAEPSNESQATTSAPPRQEPRERPPESPRPPPPGRDGGAPPKKAWYRRPLPVGLLIFFLIVIVVGGSLWWRHSRQYEKTDDAFIDVVPERVSPQVAGRVARVLVNDNQDVTAGQVLLEIDPADFQNRLDQARAAQAQAEAQVAQAEAQRTIRTAEVAQAKASLNAASVNAANAASDLHRLQVARAGDEAAASAQQLEHTQAQQRTTAAQVTAAQKAVAAAQAQLALVARNIDAARAAVRSAAAQVAEAKLSLSYAAVKATVAGRIADKTVAPGDYVSPGTDLLAIVPHDVYVTADFKETQLARIRPGQPAEITVDAYPNLKLHGKVDSVQPATGSAFTPIPAENAAGNWVKVVQRVPVKIDIDDLPNDPVERLGPGMSVEVKVTVEEKAIRREEGRGRTTDGR
ncbi:MAG TPA: HlyD family secretion protein [Opitutaceae bacterium]|nr:HlyD family secretion protein [Opitutaceae bacterium]